VNEASSGDDDSSPQASPETKLLNLQDVDSTSINSKGQASWTNSEALPWAFVLGHNWGPIGHLNSGDALYPTGRPNGVMSIPAVGTEVFVTFEGDDQNHPIIIGAVFHKDELLAMSSPTNLEVSPGLSVSNSPPLLGDGNYTDSVSDSYVIRSVKGSSLIISDIVGNEQIILGGAIPARQGAGDFINGPNTLYHSYAEAYPNFPTTASAPFASRTQLGKVSNTALTRGLAGPTVNIQPAPVPAGTQSNKCMPMKVFNGPTGGMVFHADRGGRLHNGIDLGAGGNPNIELIAPMLGSVLYIGGSESSSGGIYLIFKGADGYCHRFMHLASINTAIRLKVQKGDFSEVPMGTVLGIVGNTGKKKDGSSYPIHLHWEVIRLVSGNTSYAASINSTNAAYLFTSAQNSMPTNVPGTSVSVSTGSFIDGIKSWFNIDTGNSAILVGDQTASLYAAEGDPNDTKNDRIIGLETCMTPGKEHIYLRHSSGSYIGFDADGNFKLFTVGDAHVRVNRSAVADIFGGIITSCLAFYMRVKSVIRTASGVDPIHESNAHKFDPSPTSDKTKTYDNYPQELLEIDSSRLSDMNDSIIQATNSNQYITAASGGTKTREQVLTDGFNYVLSNNEKQDKNFTLTTFDADIKNSFVNVLGSNKKDYVTALRGSQYFKWTSFKAMMLHESNGDPNIVNGISYGLFQLQRDAVRDVKGKVKDANGKEVTPVQFIFDVQNGKMDDYLDAKLNIDTAIRYFDFCLQQVYSTYVNYFRAKSPRNLPQDITNREQDSLFMLALFAYTAGYHKVSGLINLSLSDNSNQISYIAVEEKAIKQNVPIKQINYVPIILSWILPKL
jgi:murein DD-endopeptidase MepM/ murein hydrolase activator NlpD